MPLTSQAGEHRRAWAFGRACANSLTEENSTETSREELRDEICELKITTTIINNQKFLGLNLKTSRE